MALLQPGNQVYRATQTMNFVDAGVTAANTLVIILIELDFNFTYNPAITVGNQVDHFENGKGYYLVIKQSFECPALGTSGGGSGSNNLTTDDGDNITTDDGDQIIID